jgi:hypothetical protein
MVSSIKLKIRRYLLGATPKATSVWWIGQHTERVWLPSTKISTRAVREKAHNGAEKSRRIRRKGRGLRKGKRRARGRQPRSTVTHRQPTQKPQSFRKINHVGRKFIWARKACNELAKKTRRMLAMKSRKFYSHQLGRETSRKALFKRSLKLKWKSMSDRAALIDIPYQAAFHQTWEDFVAIEASDADFGVFDFILAGLPKGKQTHQSVGGSSRGNRPSRASSIRTDEFGNSRFQAAVPQCRNCYGLGVTPGPGFPLGCRYCYRGEGRRGLNRGGRRRRR